MYLLDYRYRCFLIGDRQNGRPRRLSLQPIDEQAKENISARRRNHLVSVTFGLEGLAAGQGMFSHVIRALDGTKHFKNVLEPAYACSCSKPRVRHRNRFQTEVKRLFLEKF